MRILDSARKRGITDGAILHAMRHAIKVIEQDDDVTMFIGAAEDGTVLEVGAVMDEDDPRVIHAMPARAKFLATTRPSKQPTRPPR